MSESDRSGTTSRKPNVADASCPVPKSRYDRILLGHGSGGRLTSELIARTFLPAFDDGVLHGLEDQATVAIQTSGTGERIAITTDAFVVKPLFFPGGDIGSLAVHGTVNDLAVGGAIPRFLSAAFILEEGLPLDVLERIVGSMSAACRESDVALVTGDTKVVDHGKGDGVFVTTTGIGLVPERRALSIASARPGDALVVSGTLGDHGIAIMAAREGIELESEIRSDSAALTDLVRIMLEQTPEIRAMRDPTRGGLASAVNELAAASGVGVELDERALPVGTEVKAACEILGLDPIYVANEGKLLAVVPEAAADELVTVMRAHPLGAKAAVIGRVVAEHPGIVVLRSSIGGRRVLSMLSGEQLPRIC